MATIKELVTDAFRELNLIQVGDTPDGAEYVEAEKRLLSFIESIFGNELGEALENVFIEDEEDKEIDANVRVIISADTVSEIILPDLPNNGQRFAIKDPKGLLDSRSITINAGKNTIQGSDTLVLSATADEGQWFFRADLGDWKRVTNLVSEDPSPFPSAFDDMLIQWLSFRIAPRNGVQTLGESVAVMDRIKKMFRAEYRQVKEVNVDLALIRNTWQYRRVR